MPEVTTQSTSRRLRALGAPQTSGLFWNRLRAPDERSEEWRLEPAPRGVESLAAFTQPQLALRVPPSIIWRVRGTGDDRRYDLRLADAAGRPGLRVAGYLISRLEATDHPRAARFFPEDDSTVGQNDADCLGKLLIWLRAKGLRWT